MDMSVTDATQDVSQVSFLLPQLSVAVEATGQNLVRNFRTLAPRASASQIPKAEIRLSLGHDQQGYWFYNAQGHKGRTNSSWQACQQVLDSAHCMAIQGMTSAVIMSAAMIYHQGKAVLLVGGSGSGRSTLVLALAMAGFTVGCDSRVLVEGDIAHPLPERSALWPSSLSLLVKLPGGNSHESLQREAENHSQTFVDPLNLGANWHVDPANISAMLWLDPNFGGTSRLRRVGGGDMSRLLLQHCQPPNSGGFWMGPLLSTMGAVETAALELGSLESALACVKLFLDHVPAKS